MSVDLSKIKPGDEVTVRAVVKRAADEFGVLLCTTAGGDPDDFMAVEAEIVSHTPKALSVGDRVKADGWKVAVFTVVAIDDGWAWIKDAKSSRLQLPLSDLERIP